MVYVAYLYFIIKLLCQKYLRGNSGPWQGFVCSTFWLDRQVAIGRGVCASYQRIKSSLDGSCCTWGHSHQINTLTVAQHMVAYCGWHLQWGRKYAPHFFRMFLHFCALYTFFWLFVRNTHFCNIFAHFPHSSRGGS